MKYQTSEYCNNLKIKGLALNPPEGGWGAAYA